MKSVTSSTFSPLSSLLLPSSAPTRFLCEVRLHDGDIRVWVQMLSCKDRDRFSSDQLCNEQDDLRKKNKSPSISEQALHVFLVVFTCEKIFLKSPIFAAELRCVATTACTLTLSFIFTCASALLNLEISPGSSRPVCAFWTAAV